MKFRPTVRFYPQDDEPVGIRTTFPEFDIDADEEETCSRGDWHEPQDALILIEWNDDQPQSKTRWIFMLLRWVSDGIAERVGLLSKYRDECDTRFTKSVPRRRMKFELR